MLNRMTQVVEKSQISSCLLLNLRSYSNHILHPTKQYNSSHGMVKLTHIYTNSKSSNSQFVNVTNPGKQLNISYFIVSCILPNDLIS